MSLKTFRQIPALSWAISYSVFQPVKFASTLQKLLATFFQILDIWWSSLVIMDDFKPISRTAIFRFGEINTIMILSFVKKIFFFIFFYFFFKFWKSFYFFIFFNSKFNNKLKKKEKKNFLTKLKIMICLFHQNGKSLFYKWA